MSGFHFYHLIYANETGCDKRIGFTRMDWFLLGTALVHASNYYRQGVVHPIGTWNTIYVVANLSLHCEGPDNYIILKFGNFSARISRN